MLAGKGENMLTGKKYKPKSKTNPSITTFRIQNDGSFICEFYYIIFIRYTIARKTLLIIPILFLLKTGKKR